MAKSTNEILMDISSTVAVTNNTVRYVRAGQVEIKLAMFGVDGNGGMMKSINNLEQATENIQKEHKACMAIRLQMEKEVIELKDFKREHERVAATGKARWKAISTLIANSGIKLTGIIAILTWFWEKIKPLLFHVQQ